MQLPRRRAPRPTKRARRARPAGERAAAGSRRASREAAERPDDELPQVGANLRRLRTQRRLSLEKLSHIAGVSRAMLGQIELSQSTPTIKTLWKIARALDIPFSALISRGPSKTTAVLRAAEARKLTNHDGTFTSRALFPLGGPRFTELYEVRLAARAEEHAVAHPPGTVENLVVARGALELEVGGQCHALGTGDAAVFEADEPHVYRNPTGQEAVVYLVMIYAEPGSAR